MWSAAKNKLTGKMQYWFEVEKKIPLLRGIAALCMAFVRLYVVLRESAGCKWILPGWEKLVGEQHWTAGVNKQDRGQDFASLSKTEMLRDWGAIGRSHSLCQLRFWKKKKKAEQEGFQMSQEGLILLALKLEKEKLQNQDKHLMGEDEHSVCDVPKGPQRIRNAISSAIRWAREGLDEHDHPRSQWTLKGLQPFSEASTEKGLPGEAWGKLIPRVSSNHWDQNACLTLF